MNEIHFPPEGCSSIPPEVVRLRDLLLESGPPSLLAVSLEVCPSYSLPEACPLPSPLTDASLK